MEALKDINFLPQNMQAKNKKSKNNSTAILITVICLGIAVVLFGVPKIVYKYYQIQDEKAGYKLSQLTETKKRVSELTNIKNSTNKKIDILKKIDGQNMKVTEFIDKIQNATPYNTRIASYSISDKSLNITYEINSPIDIINIMNSLEGLNMFEKVDVDSIPIVDMKTSISFKLKLK